MLPFDLQHPIEVPKIPLLIYRKNIAGFGPFTLTVTRLKMKKIKELQYNKVTHEWSSISPSQRSLKKLREFQQ